MKYRTLETTRRGWTRFVSRFYTCKFKKADLIEWLVDLNVATQKQLENMSLPLIYCKYPNECWDALNEELEAIYLCEGER